MKRRSSVLAIAGLVTLVLVVAAIWIPHNIVSRVAHDEASTANGLRALTSLERQYAAARPSQGFSCDFAQLKTEVPSSGDHTREGFLFADPFEVTNSRLLDARPTRKEWSSDIKQPQYLPCPAKQVFVPSVLTKQTNFAMPRMVPQRVADRCSRRPAYLPWVLYGTFPVCSIKEEVKKKHFCAGWKFSCFAAHWIEQDLF